MPRRVALAVLLSIALLVSSEATGLGVLGDEDRYRLSDRVFHGVCTEVQLEQDVSGGGGGGGCAIRSQSDSQPTLAAVLLLLLAVLLCGRPSDSPGCP